MERPALGRSSAARGGQSAGVWGDPQAAAAGQVGQTRRTRGSRGQRGAALTWMVQVYSLSSSSRTVQLYSRSRLLLLPLINLLSIFPPARPREARRRCGPRTRRPSTRQLRAGPGPLHHHPSRVAAAASCWPRSSSFSCTVSVTASPSPERAPRSLSSAPQCWCPARGAGPRPEGAQWRSARRNRVADSTANRNSTLE